VCLLTAGYLFVSAREADVLRDANRLGLQGRYADALAQARRVSRPPADARAELVEAYALRELGRPVAASAAFARATRRDPGNWVIRRDWAVVLAQLGRQRQAGVQMARALALNPRMSLPPGFLPAAPPSASG
jgi:Flp pilus assembly protein TadD